MVNFKSVLVAAVGAASLGFAMVAGAQSNEQAPMLSVQYTSSSLNTEDGVHHLYTRLVSAAEKVCGPNLGRVPSEGELACRRAAVADAVAQIHNSRLAELSAHYSKAG